MSEIPSWAKGDGWRWVEDPAVAEYKSDRIQILIEADGHFKINYFEFSSPEESRRIADAIIREIKASENLCPKCNMNRKTMSRNTCMMCREPSDAEAGDAGLGPPKQPCKNCGPKSYTGWCFKCNGKAGHFCA